MPEGSEVMLGCVGGGSVIKDWIIYLTQQFLLASLKGKYGMVVIQIFMPIKLNLATLLEKPTPVF